MKIGLYGGMANNMYVFAKELAVHGIDVCQVRDRGDLFALSQPSWEDLDTTLDYAEVVQSSSWTVWQWTEWEHDHGWEAPAWLVEPGPAAPADSLIDGSLRGPLRMLVKSYLSARPHLLGALTRLRDCDGVFSGSVDGHIMAMASGRPYVLMPHGADIRIAGGLHRPPFWPPRSWLRHQGLAMLLKEAFLRASAVGQHDATGQGGHVGSVEPLMRQLRHIYLTLPTRTYERASPTQRRAMLAEVCTDSDIVAPDARIVALAPARVDFHWKGQDRLLRALTQFGPKDVHVIFPGWGADYERARQLAVELGVGEQVTFLKSCLSKQRLYRFINAADMVIDQFLFGHHGTTFVEAMARGCPVMVGINEEKFTAVGRPVPPVLNAKDTQDITRHLRDILSGRVDLERMGLDCQPYAQAFHGSGTLTKILRDTLTGSLQPSVFGARQAGI